MTLLGGFTCHNCTYWTVSPCVTETYLLDVTGQQSSCSICNDQLFHLRLINFQPQPDVHHSEEKYLELLDSFNGVTETYHLTSLTVSSGVIEPYHLTLLDSFTWRYWTVSLDVTGQFYLALLDRITWRYWTVSPGVTEPHHLMLLDY